MSAPFGTCWQPGKSVGDDNQIPALEGLIIEQLVLYIAGMRV